MDDELLEEECGHDMCQCLVEDPALYCSMYCEEADEAEDVSTRCNCGHKACAGKLP